MNCETVLARKKIDLKKVKIVINIDVSSEGDMFNDYDYDDGSGPYNTDCVSGEIFYENDDDEDDVLKQEKIGAFDFKILYGTDNKIFDFLLLEAERHLIEFGEEIFNVKYNEVLDPMNYGIKSQYEFLFEELFENSFIIFDRISINEEYRGNRILDKVINTIKRLFRQPILCKPFPLQHEGKLLPSYKEDLNKLIKSYRRCGFKKGRKNGNIYILR